MVHPVPSHTTVTCKYWAAGNWDGGHHRGIDFGCPIGTPVVAMWGGTVVEVGNPTSWGRAFGRAVVIDHDKLPDGSPGYWVIYAHLSETRVKPGQRVEAGDRIADSGDTGRVSGPHVHVEVQTSSSWRPASAGDVTCSPQPWIDAGKAPAKPVKPQYTAEIDSSLLGSGQPTDGKPRATLKELQHRLNGISLKNGRTLQITGVFDPATEHEVQLWQQQKCDDKPDPDGRVSLGPKQRKKMFPSPPYTIVDKGLPPAPSGGGTAEPEWATRLRRALQRVTATVDYRPRWIDPAIAGKHTWNPSWVVLHHTGGTNSLNWIESGADHPPVPAAGFLIARDGTVHVFSCHETYHAGAGGPLGDVPADRMNSFAWGIEIESEGKTFDLTPDQIKSVRELCAGLVEHCGVIASTRPDGPWQIINHRTWAPERKTDTLQTDAWWREQITAELTGTTPPPPTEETPVTTINVADLRHGVRNSTSVAWWQRQLNGVKLVGGSTLPDTGNFLDRTQRETALWQDQKADDKTVIDGSRVTPAQVRQMDPSVILADDAGGGGSSSTGGSGSSGSSSGSSSKLIHYQYNGKPPKPQPLKTSYVPIDADPKFGAFVAPEEGLLLSMCYTNTTWRDIPGATAQLRVRMMRRNPDDSTAHQDYTVGKINTVTREFVAGKVWFGWADKNREYEWEVDSAGFEKAQMNTRYTKWALIPQRTLDRVARAMGLPVEAVITAIVQIFRMLAESEMHDATVDLRDDDPDDGGPVPAELVAP